MRSKYTYFKCTKVNFYVCWGKIVKCPHYFRESSVLAVNVHHNVKFVLLESQNGVDWWEMSWQANYWRHQIMYMWWATIIKVMSVAKRENYSHGNCVYMQDVQEKISRFLRLWSPSRVFKKLCAQPFFFMSRRSSDVIGSCNLQNA
jgi:hypothetical protein